MKKYEILLILPGTLDENEAETKIQETVVILKDFVSNVSLNTLGKNRLAYPVKHIRYGYFYTATFSAESEQVETLKVKLSLSRDLLRAMISFSGKDADAKKITYFGDGRGPRQPEKAPFESEVKFSEIKVEEAKAEIKEEDVKKEEKEEEKREESVIEVVEKTEEKEEKKVSAEPVAVDLKEIDKKLDEILSDDSIISGV